MKQVLRTALRIVHPLAGLLAMLTITLFLIATLGSEISGQFNAIMAVKAGIVRGLFVLVPALALCGASGIRLGTAGLAAPKLKRMRVVAANGILILVPCALALDRWAQGGNLGGMFALVQALEIAAGGANLVLLGLNMRDGIRLRAGRRAGPRVRPV